MERKNEIEVGTKEKKFLRTFGDGLYMVDDKNGIFPFSDFRKKAGEICQARSRN
jgi:hypothetical protein